MKCQGKAAFTCQTNVGKLKLVCVNDTTTCWRMAKIETSSICCQQIANMLCRSHVYTNLGLPTRVGKGA